MISVVAARLSLGVLLGSMFYAAAFAAERLPADTVLASRGGATVTLRDVDASLLRIPVRQRADAMNSPKRIEELINQLLLTRQLANAGVEQGLDKDPLVQHSVAMAGESVVGAQAVLKFREGIVLGDPEQLARERYDANPQRYALPSRVNVQHVLIDTEKRSDAEAAALANEIHARAAKEDFEALVMEYSDDPSKSGNKGIVIDADSAKMDPDFAEAAGKLRTIGELAPVTKSQFGYHVIKLSARTEAKARTYDEVSTSIVEELRTSLTEQRVQEYVDQMRSMKLDANPDAVASLRSRYAVAPLLPDVSKARTPPQSGMPQNKPRKN